MSVDPRIGQELEKLNNSCEKINNLEVSLDELKRNYQELQETSQSEIKIISSKIKSAIDLARPFYEARKHSSEILKEKLNECANYEKAKTNLAAAKEMVHLAEQSAITNLQGTSGGGLDIALQEMISHATSRVNYFTDECNKAQNRLRIVELKHEMANIHVTKLQTQLKAPIKVSRPYYETRANYNAKLRSMKLKIIEMEKEIQKAKSAYNEALQSLEKISDEIHKLREDQKLNYMQEDEVEFLHQPQQQKQSSNNKNKTYLCYQNSLSDDYELVDDDDDDENEDETTPNERQERRTEEWSDIPLNSMTASNSTTSSYSQTSDREETIKNDETLSIPGDMKEEEKKSSSFSDWISKSSFRRQSLEDVFAQSTLFGKFGRSLERRNSESEVESSSSAKKEFFLFGRPDGLTDSQIENLFLPDEHL